MDKVRPGLMFQLEISSGKDKTFITSDEDTKVRNETGWDTKTPLIDGSNTAFVENFDFGRSVVGWEAAEYNDSNWENATFIRQDWWPPRKGNVKDFARMSPWHTLVPRDLPYLEETLRPVKKVFEIGECAEASMAGRGEAVEHMPILGIMQHRITPLNHCKIQNLDGFINQTLPLKIQNYSPKTLYDNEPYRSTWMVFDMGELLMGYPTIEVEGSRGTNMEVSYAPFLIDGQFNPSIVPDNLGDRVGLTGGKIRWEAQELRTFRYLGIYIGNTDKPVTITFAGVKQTYYPFKTNAPFKLGDEMLEKLSNASQKTIKIITHDAFTDNYRERKEYIQTGWYAGIGNYSSFGDPYLMRRCLVQIADDQFQNGFLPMSAPNKPKIGILEADFFWQMSLYDYYMYSGDATTTKNLLVNLKRDLVAIEDLESKDGVLDSPPHPYWIDHTDLDRRGINFTLNGWYALALDDDAKLFKLMGDSEASNKCAEKANKIKQYLKNNFWNETKGLFAETMLNGKQSNSFDEISNGVALILKIADKNQASSIAEKIRTNDETQVMVRPAVLMYWPVEGLFSAGHGDVAIQILKSRFKVMMQHEEGTLWEGWNLYTFNQSGRVYAKTRSATQAEQVFHPDVFVRNLLGCEIVKPGAKELRISYTGNMLKNMEGFVPTLQGNVKISWTLEGENKKLEIESPKTVLITINRTGFPKDIKITQNKY